MISFVAIEGLDCSGKTTFAKELVRVLQEISTPGLIHIEYVHFPYYKSKTGQEILEYLKNGDINNIKKRDKFIRLCMLNRREWFDDNYERLKKYPHSIIIADRYRHSNNFLNISKFRDIPKAIAKYRDIELNGYGIKKESLNYYLYAPEELILERLNKKKNKDQFESDENIKLVASKQNVVLRHIMDYRFSVLPAELLDEKYIIENHPEFSDISEEIVTGIFIYYAYMIARDINRVILRNTDDKAHMYIGRLLKYPKARLLAKKSIVKLMEIINKK